MARPEKAVEDYLVERVAFSGGEASKVDCRGHRGRVDRIVALPCIVHDDHFDLYYVEVKAPGEKARPEQEREHARLRRLGFTVLVIDTKEGVDEFLADYCRH